MIKDCDLHPSLPIQRPQQRLGLLQVVGIRPVVRKNTESSDAIDACDARPDIVGEKSDAQEIPSDANGNGASLASLKTLRKVHFATFASLKHTRILNPPGGYCQLEDH